MLKKKKKKKPVFRNSVRQDGLENREVDKEAVTPTPERSAKTLN